MKPTARHYEALAAAVRDARGETAEELRTDVALRLAAAISGELAGAKWRADTFVWHAADSKIVACEGCGMEMRVASAAAILEGGLPLDPEGSWKCVSCGAGLTGRGPQGYLPAYPVSDAGLARIRSEAAPERLARYEHLRDDRAERKGKLAASNAALAEGAPGTGGTMSAARVELRSTTDPYTDLKPGERGVVSFVDDAGTVHVRWDSGSNLGLVPGVDRWIEVAAVDDMEADALNRSEGVRRVQGHGIEE